MPRFDRMNGAARLAVALLALGLLTAGATAATAAVTVTNSPASVNETTTNTLSLSVTHVAPATDSVCTVRLTVNAAFTGVDTINVPAGWTATVAGQVITWTATPGNCLKASVANVTRVFPWRGTAPSTGASFSHAWLTTGGAGSGNVSTLVNEPVLSTSGKVATDLNGAPLRPGDVVRYVLTVRNTGNMTATTVSMADTLPAVFVSVAGVTGGGVVSAGPPIVIDWSIASLAAGANQAVQCDATLGTPLDGGTSVSNRATVRSDQTLPAVTAPATLAVTAAPLFSTATKTWGDLNSGLLQPGDTLTYTLTVPNSGDMHATGVTLTDALPTGGIDYVAGSTTLNGTPVTDLAGVSRVVGGMAVNSPGEPAGTVNVGESAVVTLRMKVRGDAGPGTQFNNSFSLASTQGVTGSAAAPPATVLGASHVLTAQLPATASTCDELSYSLKFVASTSVAFDTWYESILPAGLAYVPGSTEVTNSALPGLNTAEPEIVGSTLRFNYAGTPNPVDDPRWDVAPADTLTVHFRVKVAVCAPGSYSLTSSASFRAGAAAPYTLLAPASVSSTTVLEGSLAVTKTPVAPSAQLNDVIFYTIRVRSVGFGAIGNVAVTDSLRTGLRLVPGLTVPAPTSFTLNPDSTTSIHWAPSVGQLARLDAGQEQVITLAVRLVSCTDYDDIVTARWGCEATPCQVKTATASVTLVLNEPKIAFSLNPSPISVPACDTTGVPVTFTVTNTGGEARGMDLFMTGFPAGLSVVDVSGASYTPGSPATFGVGTLLANEVRNITFRVRHIDNCASPSGTLVFTTRYTNLCGDPYTFTALIGSISSQSMPGVSVTKSGPVEILAGTSDTWTIHVCFGPGLPADTVWVTDSYPAGFTFVGNENPPAFSGGGPGAANSSWFFLPAAFAGTGCVDITYSLQATGACGTEGSTAANVSTVVPCGAVVCGSSGSASTITAIDCPDNTAPCVTTMTHTVNNAPETTSEVCVPMTHRVTVNFATNPAPGLDFADITFKAQARHDKTLVGVRQLDGTWAYGKARFTFTDSLGRSCALDLEPTRDGNNELSWDLKPLDDLGGTPGCPFGAAPVLAGGMLQVTYDLVSTPTLAYHYEFARLVIDGGPGFACNGTVDEPVEVTVARSTMSVGIGIGATAEKCVAVAVPISLGKGGAYGTYDNVLYLSTEGYEYIDDPSDPGYFLPVFSGGLPNVGVPTRVNDVGNGTPGVMWKLGDLPAGFGSGTILVPLRKRCADHPAYARLVYDDRCGNDDTDNIDQNSLVTTATASPTLVLSADVTLKLTPLTNYVTADTASWTLYCINGGAGAVEKLNITSSTPGTGISFLDVQLLDQAGTPRPGDLRVTYGPANRSVNYVISRIPAGQTWRILVRATAQGCTGLIHDVSGFWGCAGDTCQSGPQLTQQGAVAFPPATVIADIVGSVNVASCGPTAVTTQLKNASLVRVRQNVYRMQLPVGLTYLDNSTTISINHVGGATAPTVIAPSGNPADPVVSGQELVWVLENYLSTNFLSPEDVVTIACQLRAAPAFGGGVLDAVGTYVDECGGPAFMTADRVPVTTTPLDATALTVGTTFDSLQACTVAGVDDNLVVLTVANPAGNGTAYGVMNLTAALPEGLTYAAFSTSITYPTASGTATWTTNPTITGTGLAGNPQRLRWSLPPTVQLDGGDNLVVRFRLLHAATPGCPVPRDGIVLTVEGGRCASGVAGGESFTQVLDPIAVALRRPELALGLFTLDLTPNGVTAPGDTLRATAVVRNDGAGWSRSRTLRLRIDPTQLTFLSATPAANAVLGGLYTWTTSLPALAPGATDSVRLVARIQQGVSLGAIVAIDADVTDNCCGDLKSDRNFLTVSGAPHLDIEKFSADAVIVPGGTVTYEIFVRNDGGQSFQNVVVTETATLPGLTYSASQFDSSRVSFTGSAAAPAWTIARSSTGQPKFYPNATEVIRLSYTVAANYSTIGTPAGIGYVYNRASITAVQNVLGAAVTGAAVLDTDGERVPVSVPGAALDIQKVAVQGVVVPGELVTFLLRVTNTGGQDLTNVVVTDPVPAGLTLQSAQIDAASTVQNSAAPPTFTIASLPARHQQLIALTFRASSNPAALGATVSNTANASGRDQANTVVNATASTVSVPVQPNSGSLDIDKVATSGTAEPGGAVTYTLTVHNYGAVDLTNVVVTDTPPAGLIYAGSQVDAGVTLNSTTPPTFTIAALPAGGLEQIALTFDVAADPNTVSDPVINTAGAQGTDPSGGTVTAATATCSIPRGTPAPSLDVAKVALSPSLVPGQPVTYLITARNGGNVPLTNVLLTDPVPAGLTYRTSSYDNDVALVTSAPPTFRIAGLPVGGVEVFSITFDTPVNPGAVANPTRNIVNAQGTAPGGALISAAADTVLLGVTPDLARLDLDKVATTGVVVPGGTVTWHLHIRNTGAVDLTGVTVIDTPPPGLTFATAQFGAGVIQTSNAPPTYALAALPAGTGEIIALTFAVSPNAGDLTNPVVNSASASGTAPGGAPVAVGPITSSLPRGVPGRGLDVRKVATESFVTPGGAITYLLTVTNTGDQALTNVDVVDLAPAGLAYDHAQFNAATVTQTGAAPPTWRVASLAPHAFEIIAVTFTAAANPAAMADPVVNRAFGLGVDPSGGTVAADTTDCRVPQGGGAPHLDIEKSSSDAVLVPGGTVTYQILVRNDGGLSLQNVVVDETPSLPGLAYLASQFDSSRVAFTGTPGAPQWTIARTASGQAAFYPNAAEVIRISYRVSADYAAIGTPAGSGVVNNVATIAGAEDLSGAARTGGAILDSDGERIPVTVPGAALDIQKVAVQGVVEPGELVTFLLRVTNIGDQDLAGVVVTDTPPAGLTIESAQYDAASTVQNSLAPPNFTIAALPVHGQQLIALTFRASEDVSLLGATISNTAGAAGRDQSGVPVPAAASSVTIPVRPKSAGLDVRKVATESFVTPGRAITYLLTVTNTGDQALTNVDVVDLAPAGLAYDHAQFNAATVTQTGAAPPTWRIAALAPHAFEIIAVTFTAAANPAAMADPVVNRAFGSGVDPSGGTVAADTTDCRVPQKDAGPRVDIEKSALTLPLTAGGEASWLLTVVNAGGTPLTGISVSDILPAGLTYLNADPPAVEAPAGTLTWTLADLDPGQVRQITMTTLVSPVSGAAITNTAGVTALAPGGTVITDTDAATAPVRLAGSSIHVEKTPTSGFLVLGGQVTYILTVSNDGEQALTTVALADSLPQGTVFAHSDHDPARWTLVTTSPEARWNLLGGLAPGQSEQITLSLNGAADLADFGLASGDTTLVNAARVGAVDPQGGAVTDRDEARVEINVPRGAVLLNKTATVGEVVPGQQVTYLLTVENVGDQDLFPFEVREPDISAQGLTYLASDYDSTNFAFSISSGGLTWSSRAAYTPGARDQIRVTYLATTNLDSLANPIINVATAVGNDESGQVVIDSDSEGLPLNVLSAALSVNKSATQGQVTPGELVTWTLTVANTGELPLRNVRLQESDLGPQGLTLFEARYDSTFWQRSDSLTFVARDTLATGAIEVLRLTWRASADPTQLPARVTNRATVSGIDLYGRALADSADESLPVLVPGASLELHKKATSAALLPGQPVTWLLTLTNNGRQVLNNVAVTDTLPPGTSVPLSDHDAARVTFSVTGSVVRWTLNGPLQPGASETIRLSAATSANAADLLDPTVNRASARALAADGSVLTAADSARLPLQLPFSALSVAKIPAQNVVVPGGVLLYTLLVENRGDAPLHDVQVVEAPPAGLGYEGSAYDSSLVQWSGNAAAPRWTIAAFPVGARTVLQVRFRAAADPLQIESPAINRVTVDGLDPSGRGVTARGESLLPVQARDARLRVEKVALEPVVVPGAPMAWEVRVTNVGADSLFGVVVTDDLPAGFNGPLSTHETARAAYAATPRPAWTLAAPLAPGDLFTARLTATAALSQLELPDPVVNHARAWGTNRAGTTAADSAAESVPVAQGRPAVNIQKSTTMPVVVAGQPMAYTITVTNTGDRELRDLVVRDVVPAGLSFGSSWFDAVHVQFSGTPAAPAWTIPRLPRGELETITLRCDAEANAAAIPNPVVNLALVSGHDAAGTSVEDRDDESTPIQDGAPALHIDKVATTGSLTPGGEVTYLLTVLNAGAEALTDVRVDDPTPAGLGYQASQFDAVHVLETTVPGAPAWFIPRLPVGGFEQIRVSYRVDPGLTAPGTIRNTARAQGRDARGAAVSDSDDELLPVAEPRPALHVDKSATQGSIVPGEEITYLLTVTNTGNAPLRNAVVEEQPDAALSYLDSNFDNRRVSVSPSTTPLRWFIANLAPGEIEQIRVTWRAARSLSSAGAPESVTNRVVVSAGTAEGETLTDDDDDTLPVRRQPSSIQILKWTDFTGQAATQGSEVAYHLFVVNTGPQPLTGVTATDYLPPALAFGQADLAPASAGAPEPGHGGHVTWSIGTLAPQEGWEVLVVTKIRETLPLGAPLLNRAVTAGIDPAGQFVRDEDSALVRVRLPQVLIEKSADRAQARPGDVVTYRVGWRNTGEIEARAVVVVDELPAATTYVDGSATGGATYQAAERRIVLDVGTLPAGAASSFTYKVRLAETLRAPDRVPNAATLYAQDLSPALSDTVWVTVSDQPLTLRKSVDQSVASTGDTLTYNLTWQVSGPGAADDVVVRDLLPGLTAYLPGSSAPAAGYDPVLQQLTWMLGRLTAGSAGALSYRVVVAADAAAGDRILNDATIGAAGIHTTTSNQVATVLVPPARLVIEKQVDRPLAQPGDTLTFTLVVANRETRPARDVVLTDDLPTELVYLAGSAAAARFDLGQLSWTLGTLLPGDRRVVTFRATVRPDVASGTQIVNVARAAGADAAVVQSNAVLTLILYTEIELTKTANRQEASIGATVTYTLTARNSGNARAGALTLEDTLPEGFQYVSGSTRRAQGAGTTPFEPLRTEPLTWELGGLDPGQQIQLLYDVVVGSAAAEGRQRNCVSARGLGASGDSLHAGPACVDLNVVAPHLVITKTTPERTVEPGELVLYTITVRNSSRSDVREVRVEDRPSIGFHYVRGTARLDGQGLAEPVGGNPWVWSLGDLPAGASRTLEYDMITGLNAPDGVAANVATAEGIDALGSPVQAGPAEARVTVLQPRRPAAVQGWVFLDCDNDGQPDSGSVVRSAVPGIELRLEDGRRIRTDERGEYYLYPLEGGDHLLRLDTSRLTPGTRLVGPAQRFFYALAGGQARVNFRVCVDGREGLLRFAKSASTSVVARRSSGGEPERFTLGGVLFDTGRATLRPEADGALGEVGRRLRELTEATARVEGHTDIRPIRTREFPDNYALSVARAASVRQALVTRFGIEASRIRSTGFGPDHPVAEGGTPEALQRNRRVEVLIDHPAPGGGDSGAYEPAEIEYRLTLVYTGEIPLAGLVVEDLLPAGLSYRSGSGRQDGQAGAEPEVVREGGATRLRWPLGDMSHGFQRVISYGARIDSLSPDVTLTNEARVSWRGGSGLAEATATVGADVRLGASSDVRSVRHTLDGVLFDTGRAELRPAADAVLRRILASIQGVETPRIVVEGHTDDRPIRRGAFPDNQALSEARASAVADWLSREGGFNRASITARGYGPTRPVETNDSPEGRQKNRRVEIEVTGRVARESMPGGLPAGAGVRPSDTEVRIRSTPSAASRAAREPARR